MKYALGNMLNGAGGLNADQLALDLQFAADKTLTARRGPTPVFTRGSSATFVGSNGLIQSAGNNVARFDHDPVTLASRGLLIEEGRTNLLQRSEEFGNAYWTAVRASITTDATTSPDGATTADKLIADTTAANTHRVDRPTVTLALNTVHTVSIFAKASEYTGLSLGVGLSAVEGVRFSLVGAGTATPVSGSGHTGTIQQLANGWYRCTATFTSDAATAIHRVAIYVGQNGTTFTYTGDNASGIFIWGAQIEAGSFATSYIPTTTSALARSADVCSIAAGPFATFYNPAGGTIAITQTVNTVSPLATPEACRIVGSVGQLQFGATNYVNEALRFYSVGSVIRNLRTGTRASGVQFKTAMAFANNYLAACLDNGSVLTDTTTQNIPIGVSMTIGFNAACMHIARLQYFKKRLPNAKLQALTA